MKLTSTPINNPQEVQTLTQTSIRVLGETKRLQLSQKVTLDRSSKQVVDFEQEQLLLINQLQRLKQENSTSKGETQLEVKTVHSQSIRDLESLKYSTQAELKAGVEIVSFDSFI